MAERKRFRKKYPFRYLFVKFKSDRYADEPELSSQPDF